MLLVEDEQFLCDAIARGLRRDGAVVDVAFDGASALDKLGVNRYDVVVLDRDLPVVHGDDVCRSVVEGWDRPRILMLTAANDVGDLVDGLALGADDYLGKPFDFRELVARVRALARLRGSARPPVVSHGEITIDLGRHRAERSGGALSLTRKEFAIWRASSAPRARSSPRSSCSSMHGTSMPTHSPMR